MTEQSKKNETRIAVVGIIVSNREDEANKVNEILSNYGHLIVGRMGLPYKDKGISIISLIVDGTNDDIGAMTGKLGNIKGVKVKSVVTY
ncbi:TM1266 family iron-only hydrogenase system putative regulator [Petroclostridium sp. X23]|uniref:TM1266 family iron-only hydrogenase system putative regulator n=1 Tax=Petroclostridium sp. X23 TaxID=3045146 RepID=UPI0024AD4A1E|nr:TM1266 family iron-only hydrogenase system putative regulator [Petroclostridium sp. X23]WHH61322.1 iron-only hydrogenase system regulator [Petroclostridium sp. X23]